MGELLIQELKWDSDFFGIKIGLVEFDVFDYFALRQTLDLANSEHFKLIYGFQNSNFDHDDDTIKKLNGKLIDQKVIFSIDVDSKLLNDNQIETYLADLPNQAIYDLAILSGQYSRFKKDLTFGKDKFEGLYKLWIENSINGKIADKVFVSKSPEQEINGIITLKTNGNIANIGLLSVNPNFQGQGIGQKLMDKSLYHCQKNSVKSLKVPTQLDNHQACNFYKKYGFKVEKITNIFHFYL